MKAEKKLDLAKRQITSFIIKKVIVAILSIVVMLIGCKLVNDAANFNTQYGADAMFGYIFQTLYVFVVVALTIVDIMSGYLRFKKYKDKMLKEINFSIMLNRGY